LHADARSVTPCYRAAWAAWQERTDIYDVPGSFRYLPPFAVYVYAPFASLGEPAGSIAWRWALAVLMGSGLIRLVRALGVDRRGWAAPAALAMALPGAFSSLQSGQANLLLAAIMLHAAAALARQRSNEAAAWLALAVIAKTIGVAMLALALVVHPRAALRAIGGVVILLLLPFLHADALYVLAQYESLARRMPTWTVHVEHRFSDLRAMLREVGLPMPDAAALAARVLVGAFAAGLCWWRVRARAAPQRAFLLFAVAGIYLMLFNPMTEVNSYVILAPVPAVLAAAILVRRPTAPGGWLLAGMCLLLSADNVSRPVLLATRNWLSPAIAVALLIWLCSLLLWSRRLPGLELAASGTRVGPLR